MPRPPGDEYAYFGGTVRDLAVDPTNGDLIVPVSYGIGNNIGRGAVDEFDASGHFLGQIVEEPKASPLNGAQAAALDSQGHLYVVNRPVNGASGVVDVYDAGGFIPAVRIARRDRPYPDDGRAWRLGGPRIAAHPRTV